MTATGFSINGINVPAGTRDVLRLPVVTDTDGQELSIYLHVVSGAMPGATFSIIAAMHGKHWFSSETTRRFVESLDPTEMQGNLLAVAVGNPLALAHRTRHVRDESDSQDVNSVFGISKKFIPNQFAETLTDAVLKNSDAYGIVYGGPQWAVKSMTIPRDGPERTVANRSYRLARAFGVPFIRCEDTSPGHSVAYATAELGIPSFLAELGGAGFDPDQEEQWFAANVSGLHNVLRHLKILPGEEVVPDRVLVFPQHIKINPSVGGILEPLLPVDMLMTNELQKDQLLGRVWSPHSFETLEELRSPVRGRSDLVTFARPVRPGDWSAMMVDMDDPFTRWLEPHEVPEW